MFVKGDTRINRKGRPKKGHALSDRLREMGKKIVEKTTQTKNDLLAEQIWTRALDGDQNDIKTILDRTEGKPVAKVESESVLLIEDRVEDFTKEKLLEKINENMRMVGETILISDSEADSD